MSIVQNKKLIRQLNEAIENDDETIFTSLFENLTPRQFISIENLLHENYTVFMWTYCVSWSFEIHWFKLSLMSEDELNEFIKQGVDVDIPDNLTPDKPFKEHLKFAPQDAMHKLY